MARSFEKKGISSVEDALFYLPLRYEDRRTPVPFVSLRSGEKAVMVGEVVSARESRYRWKRVFEVVVKDETGVLKATWFNYTSSYLHGIFRVGKRCVLFGEVRVYKGEKQVIHPDFEVLENPPSNPPFEKGAGPPCREALQGERGFEDDSLNFGRIVPIYSQIEGIYPGTLRRIMKSVADLYPPLAKEELPDAIRLAHRLMDLQRAFSQAHFPEDLALADQARRRLIFDEFFLLELGLGLKRKGIRLEQGIAMAEPETGKNLSSKLLSLLPFALTGAQKLALADIRKDMAAAHPMNRLLQGDVGCGKTIVALLSALTAIVNGHQAGIMAPTEILAEQHYLTIKGWTEQLGLRACLLTSGLRGRDRGSILSSLASGDIHIAVGTHALIQGEVEFKSLGLGIIDEQHRFGVIQRAAMKRKGISPHILVMTATPIPRTLAMTVYGDLDLTVIDEAPPGRKKITTRVFHERERSKAYGLVKKEITEGRQAFIVYPLVEESEKLELKNAVDMQRHLQTDIFSDLRVGLLHGRMSADEKEHVMTMFKDRKLDILACTTVIEVGIDVPNATVMMVEHAERFGLSQLHQLRGRVGRGEYPSLCLLLADYKKTDDARRRLAVMEQTQDGFRIAEEDLDIRGPGEFFGTRQSGLPELRIGNILRDSRVLAEAREEAFALLERDPGLEAPEHHGLRAALGERWKGRLELGTIA